MKSFKEEWEYKLLQGVMSLGLVILVEILKPRYEYNMHLGILLAFYYYFDCIVAIPECIC